MFQFLIGTFLGAVITNFVERWLRERSQLVYYLQVILNHNVQLNSTPPQTILLCTHSIAIQNNGGRAANNVEVIHVFLPQHITVNPPDVQHTVDRQRGVIRFNTIVPRQLITIGYLNETVYTPQQIFATSVRSDEGFARPLAMTQNPVMSRWFNRTVIVVFFLGILAIVFIGYKLSPYIAQFFSWFIGFIKK